MSSDPFEIDNDDKLFSESYDSNEQMKMRKKNPITLMREEDMNLDYAESDSDIIDTNTPPYQF